MDAPAADDRSVFPDAVYKETVLEPLFDGARTHFVGGFNSIDRAHLVMLHRTGILASDQVHSIARALSAIALEVDPMSLKYTGDVEDYFFLVEKELKDRLGPDLCGRLHTARSRNDIDHTLFKLALRPRIDVLTARLVDLLKTLIDAAERGRSAIIVAYTHGQPAQPTTFGHYLSAYVEVLINDVDRLLAARGIVNLCPLGSAAITTSGFPIDRTLTARLLGFAAPTQNSYGSIAAADYLTATFGALELAFLHLGRIAQDFQFWTAFEVGQLYLPNSLVQISSIMPQKRNPVPIEHLRLLSSQVFGRARAVLEIVHNTPFTDINDTEGATQIFGYEAFEAAERAIALFAAVVAAASVNEARVEANIRRSCIAISELADTLVREEGLSFRQSHGIAGAVARKVLAAGGDLVSDGYAPFVAEFAASVGRSSVIDARRFGEIVGPEHFIAVRQAFGGPATKPLAAALADYRSRHAGFVSGLLEFQEQIETARAELDLAFAQLLGTG